MPPTKYLSVQDTAEYMQISKSWLAKSRLNGDGPPFIKVGRLVLYDLNDVDTWLSDRKRRSTSDVFLA